MSDSKVFKAAIKLPIEKRRAYVDQACGSNTELRREVESLLAAHDQLDGFLVNPTNPVDERKTDATQDLAATEATGTVIGDYKLLERIGEGGFGVVYMAEQKQPIRRRVALKIIKPGMDSKQVIGRFEAERQALAMMDHPNIAKILDAGSTVNGRPYFVMELVRGIPVTEFCDDRELSTEDRLQIFTKICSAVHHAHQKGVIHRDIKPGNVLVATIGDEPIPKVIDFGIAKATQGQLTEKTVFTQFHQFIGTPAYMSPEQAQMSAVDVDTRSDVYSLGVLLYQLLTGTTPLDSSHLLRAGYDEVCRRIREEEAPRPSKRISSLEPEERTSLAGTRGMDPKTMASKLHGELDWIVMKAIEKDRRRRYDSTGALEMDLQRYLNKEPVLAVPPSTLYLVSKFIRRHRAATMTVGIVVASLLLGSALALRGTIEALEQRDRAEDSRRKLESQVKETDAALAKSKESERKAIYTSYLADMQAGHQALAAHNLRLAKQILDKHDHYTVDFDPRHFEYHALRLRCKGEAQHTFTVPHEWVSPITFSNDGKWLAGCCQNGITKIWNTSDWAANPVILEGPERVKFSPAGSRLYGVQDGEIQSWHWPSLVQTDEALTVESPIRELCISLDGKTLATLGIGAPPGHGRVFVTTYDLPSGTQRHRFKTNGRLGSGGRISISADGTKLVLGLMENTRIVDLRTNEDALNIDELGRGAARLSPDGKWLLTNHGLIDRMIHVRRASDGELVTQLQGHDLGVRHVKFSPDGNFVASASSDQTVRLWDTKTWSQVRVLSGHSCTVRELVFSPNGKQLVSFAHPSEFCVWDLDSDTEETWPICKPDLVAGDWEDNYPRHVATFSSDSKHIAICDVHNGVTLLSAASLRRIRDLPALGQDVHSVRFAPTESTLAVGFQDGSFALVDPDAPHDADRRMVMPGWKVATSSFSADGSRLLLVAKQPGESRFRLFVYSIRDQKELVTWDLNEELITASISPDGETVMVGDYENASLWSITDPKEPRELTLDSGCQEIAMSPDGRHIVLDVGSDSVGIVDVAKGELVDYLIGHRYNVASLQFSPDGRRVAVGANDIESLKIWDFQTRRELLTLSTSGWYHQYVEWSPDGNAILLLSGGGRISLWRVPRL